MVHLCVIVLLRRCSYSLLTCPPLKPPPVNELSPTTTSATSYKPHYEQDKKRKIAVVRRNYGYFFGNLLKRATRRQATSMQRHSYVICRVSKN